MQSKFLEGVDSHTPEKDVDAITQAKRQVQRILMKAGYKCDARAFDDNCILHLDDGTEIKFEIVDVKKPEVEDQESDIDVAQIATKDNEDIEKAKDELNKKLVQSMNKLTSQIK